MDPMLATLTDKFSECFGQLPERYFSAPGRTEIGGNHTDHQLGRVLAAAVELDTRALCEGLLAGRGACRVHGGGFAGIVQAFVPNDLLPDFRSGMEAVLGRNSCHIVNIRSQGGMEL